MKNIDLYQKLAQISLDNGQTEKAIQTYQTILGIDPGNEMAIDELSTILISQNEIPVAIEKLISAIPAARSSSAEKKFFRILGDLYLRLGNHRKAIETFEKLNSIGSDLPDSGNTNLNKSVRTPENAEDTPLVWNEFGLVMNKVGAYDDAVEAFEKGISLDPTLPFLHLNLAQVLVLQGKLSEAMDEYDLAYGHTQDLDGKNAILKRMIGVFKLNNQPELVEITNEIITSLAVNESKKNGGYMILPIESIAQPEEEMGEDLISDLENSIRLQGIIQPLVISPIVGSDKFSIIAGKKRYFAAKTVGLKNIPCIVREVSEIEKIEIAFHENLHNAINNPVNAVEQYQKLFADHDLTIEGVARTTGVTSFSVANRIKAVGNRDVFENKAFSKDQKITLERMIGNLKELESLPNNSESTNTEIQTGKFEINDKFFDKESSSIGTLWYTDETPSNAVSEPTKVNFSSLFSRASGILKANPQKQKVLA
ncbi:MAG TPA: ParB/RepB/Spo0J family partition protein [Anaerolineales bacterium]|nr:ParB/RepB/Spo0J family partition protein [Anaerolineales bacterium]